MKLRFSLLNPELATIAIEVLSARMILFYKSLKNKADQRIIRMISEMACLDPKYSKKSPEFSFSKRGFTFATTKAYGCKIILNP